MNRMNNMEENFNDSHHKPQMDPLEDANHTEKLDKQSGKIANAFNDMKDDVAGGKEPSIEGMCARNDRNHDKEDEKKRRESDVRNKEI
ncbi:hypothetical protein CRE_09428 [Caenorhabditis remanei]|uniref:Uncharacterized protein n=1 Tax=Caenorhabditis remanei TaxID=31234 RepID=E3LIS6_CAERE|nr:hypothetical protein CRE_09428 [Caenorhabditis remanei]